jgi:hypothetical protein
MWIKITPIFPLPSIMQQESKSLWFNPKFQTNRDRIKGECFQLITNNCQYFAHHTHNRTTSFVTVD